MKIYDIPQATKITINMVHNNQNQTVEATVLTRYGDGILITPISCNGQLIDIVSNANFEYVEALTDDKHVFQADTISRVDFAGTDFHVVTGREIVIADNQRKAERYNVQIMGTAVINKSFSISVVLHDISMRGFSLMVGKNSGYKIGDKVKVEFAKDESSARMAMYGIVVREFSIGGYNAVGCEIENISPKVLSFIMEKKIEHAKKTTAMAIFQAEQAAVV
ncbi:PilZ domain-containing protein [Butyrivibrio sp. VCB2006]|uniref:PilZ domain-containing protein n=1 Tax=Butyrivibrio sp. VCB2006 TaxID=1280679 RepID=UPI0004925566|nr:PilZ domain-containing protein [Butyrivibrio sp. VCB2006]